MSSGLAKLEPPLNTPLKYLGGGTSGDPAVPAKALFPLVTTISQP